MKEQGIKVASHIEYIYTDDMHQLYDTRLDVFYPCIDIIEGIICNKVIFCDIFSDNNFMMIQDKYGKVSIGDGIWKSEYKRYK